MLYKRKQVNTESMKTTTTKPCRLLRKRLFTGMQQAVRAPLQGLFQRLGLDPEAEWVQRHIAVCPRCQRRFARTARVKLALTLMKSQSYRANLLPRANTQTLSTLKHSLRHTVEAEKLKVYRPQPGLWDTWRSLRGSLTQMAACLALFVLGKVGTFTSIEKAQSLGQKAVQQYYTQGVGEDLTSELFDA